MSIEKLLRSQPGTVLPDNISSAGSASKRQYWSQQCPECRGRKRVKIDGDWNACKRCGGSGKKFERSAESTTRSAFTGMTAAECAGYAASAGLSDLEWKAVQAYLFNDESVIPNLFRETYTAILCQKNPEKQRVRDQYFDLSRLAVMEMIYPHRFQYETKRAQLLSTSRKTWYYSYRPLYPAVKEIPADWLRHGLYGLELVLN